ncbi:MAG: hypothetical protein QMD01_01245 [Thermodesulfovibrionales bacterium]|nr:hypothetical protein [Thermodesulfovibrionales bacterium]
MFCICFALLLPALSFADVEIGEDRYDENTEITIKGTVAVIARGMRGPVILRLKSGDRVFNVVTAPPWYLSREGIIFQTGMELEITGSKFFGGDGSLYIMCRQIKYPDGRSIILRDKMCKPMWRGSRTPNRQMP